MTGLGMRKFTEDFKREAVRLVQTSGRTIEQVADDLGIGRSTLGKWLAKHRDADLAAGPHSQPIQPVARDLWQPKLREDGIAVGRHRVARLMRENGLNAVQRRRFKKTTDSAHGGPVAPNVLDQDFAADGPDQKWGADISYIWTAEGWLYLAVVVDLFSRRIVGWATSDRMKKDLALTALKRALAMRQPPPGLIHHSDRGSQYCSGDYENSWPTTRSSLP